MATWSVASLLTAAIIYLALALSRLAQRVSRLEGRMDSKPKE